MQLYVSDFLGDTMHLTTEQIGGYMLLLMAMWNANGALPVDDKRLARIARMSSRKWAANKDEMLAFFDEADGALTHKRVTQELQKVSKLSEFRRQIGAKGGASKSLKYNSQYLAKASHLLGNHNQNHIEGILDLEVKGFAVEGVKLDRYVDTALFKAAEALLTAPVPKWKQVYEFPRDIVTMAKEAMK
jgi:uncharacterized protein YdaU (DUF1376 family)